VSHELRSPLNAIVAWGQVLQTNGIKMDNAARAIRAILNNAKTQAELIDDLLEISRILSRHQRFDFEPVNLADLVLEVMESVAPIAEDKRIIIALDLQEHIDVNVDRLRIRQVIWNLLSNAIKFSSFDTTIRASLSGLGQYAQFTLTDQGEGISPDFLPHVFERFAQGESQGRRRHAGLGLGMAISRNIVEAHGGLLRAASPGKGMGATFMLQLPLATCLGAVRPGQSPARLDLGNDQPLARRRVLTVEDQAESREAVRLLLKAAGAEVTAIDSADAALRLLRRTAFDALVTELAMPGMDGIELVRRLYEEDPARLAVPAVLLTAFDDGASAALAKHAGFYQTLAKPVSREELIQSVARACALHDAARDASAPASTSADGDG
jgi:CheY-like chemotaxis protein